MDKEYQKALRVAEERLQDLTERGKSAVGSDWQDVRKEIFTPEEIAASDMRVAIMLDFIKARREKGLTQTELAKLAKVNQPHISKFETGDTMPTLVTLQKLLAPLGKKLAIVPI